MRLLIASLAMLAGVCGCSSHGPEQCDLGHYETRHVPAQMRHDPTTDTIVFDPAYDYEAWVCDMHTASRPDD